VVNTKDIVDTTEIEEHVGKLFLLFDPVMVQIQSLIKTNKKKTIFFKLKNSNKKR
jgi:hypothetical protein